MSQQREGYYDYMLRRSREEDSRGRSDILEHTIQEMQNEIDGTKNCVWYRRKDS